MNNCKFELVDIDNLTLDVENPRIKKWIEYYGHPTEAQIKLALGVASGEEARDGGTTYESLRESIKASGGINHPIIVNKNNSNMIVIEGNTRLSIYQEFRASDIEGDWGKIPAMVYENLDLENIDAIRLQSHLVGPRAWDPYSKAKYLTHLHNVEHMTVERIISYCGGKQREVKDYIDAYRDMEQYYRPILESDQDFDTTRFSGFVELQKPGVKEAILKCGKTLEDFARWIHTKNLHPLSLVRQLPKILNNNKSREIFFQDGAKEALQVLDSPSIEKALQELELADLCRALQRAIDNLQYQKYKEMQTNENDSDRAAILDLKYSFIPLLQDLDEK